MGTTRTDVEPRGIPSYFSRHFFDLESSWLVGKGYENPPERFQSNADNPRAICITLARWIIVQHESGKGDIHQIKSVAFGWKCSIRLRVHHVDGESGTRLRV